MNIHFNVPTVLCVGSFIVAAALHFALLLWKELSFSIRTVIGGRLVVPASIRILERISLLWWMTSISLTATLIFPAEIAALTISLTSLGSLVILAKSRTFWEFIADGVISIFSTVASYSILYWIYGVLVHEQPICDIQLATYFSVVTWTTLGYGDCLPTAECRLAASIQAFTGYVTMTLFLGLLLTVSHRKEPTSPSVLEPFIRDVIAKFADAAAQAQSAAEEECENSGVPVGHLYCYHGA